MDALDDLLDLGGDATEAEQVRDGEVGEPPGGSADRSFTMDAEVALKPKSEPTPRDGRPRYKSG